MRITKTLTRRIGQEFFWGDEHNAVCVKFVSALADRPMRNVLAVDITLSTINPKKKDFSKVVRVADNRVKLGSKPFEICYDERVTLSEAGINVGDKFWMKVK